MCVIYGKEKSKKLATEHELEKFRVGSCIFLGYLNPLGLLFVPFGTFIGVYGEDEFTCWEEVL